MRSSVITNEEAKGHFVENYRFKILGQEKKSDHYRDDFVQSKTEDDVDQEIEKTITNTAKKEPDVIPAQTNFVEELLKKTDELSGNIIKLQMQIENQESEFAKRLESETLKAKDDGIKQGFDEAMIKFNEELKAIESRYVKSISKLEDEAEKFSKLLVSSEEELANTAIEIAKEVVQKEILANSSNVATALCQTLIKELKDASSIHIKVSAKDYELIKERFASSENISVSADEAINVGGVIVMSGVGNLDGTIEARFEKIKKIVGQ